MDFEKAFDLVGKSADALGAMLAHKDKRIEELEAVLALAQKAVAYHRLGYGPNSLDFDADTMLALLDDLGEATDAA
jgi:hypothetical protein